MPLFNWKCENCNNKTTRLYSLKDCEKGEICSKCKENMVRDHKGINSQCYETLDNGLMSKKVERLVDAQRIYHEHSKIDPFKDK